MKKVGLFLGAGLLSLAAFTSCKECKTCEVTTFRQIPTDTVGIIFDTTLVNQEVCGTLLENVDGQVFVDSSASNGVLTTKTYQNCK